MKFVIIRLARIALNTRSVLNVLGSKSSKRIAGFTCNRLTHQLTVTSVGLTPGMHHGIWKTLLHSLLHLLLCTPLQTALPRYCTTSTSWNRNPFFQSQTGFSCRWIGRRWRLRLRRSPLSNSSSSSSSRVYSLSSRSPRSRPKWPEIEIMRRASSWTATNFVAQSAFQRPLRFLK